MQQEKVYINIAELNLLEGGDELVGFNPDADANAPPPLIPAGPYVATVRFAVSDARHRWHKRETTFGGGKFQYEHAELIVRILEGEHEGREVFESVSTLPRHIGIPISSAQAALAALRNNPELRTVPKAARFVVSGLNEEIGCASKSCRVRIDWIAFKWDAARRKKRVLQSGMENFPKDASGRYIPQIATAGGEIVRARNFVSAWRPLGAVTTAV